MHHILQRKAAERSTEKTKRAPAKKDKNAPKRALSAYMFFSQDWRERIKAENPDAGFGECTTLLSRPVLVIVIGNDDRVRAWYANTFLFGR
jgi:hypothetical protein